MDFLALDLAASSKRPTGYAYVENGVLKTGHIYSDEEILEMAKQFNVVGIDAPLSLPYGRSSIDIKSPHHLRMCDILLKRRKIRFFPITIGPMRMLTKRGMKLKKELNNAVELFPGASYDILGLPRKDILAVERFLEPFQPNLKSQHEADAAIGWFTMWLWKNGAAEWLKGIDGKILIPKPAIYLGKKYVAVFKSRINRFVLETSLGKAYLRDTARLTHLLKPNTLLYLTPYKGKFNYMVKAVWDGKRWVLLDSFLDNKLFWLYMRSIGKLLKPAPKQDNILYDFWDGKQFYEVKGAHLFKGDIALFPDTYSKRAEKHFKHLNGEVIFVAHRSACCVSINPEYVSLEKYIKKAWGLSTRIINNYIVVEGSIPYRFINEWEKT